MKKKTEEVKVDSVPAKKEPVLSHLEHPDMNTIKTKINEIVDYINAQ